MNESYLLFMSNPLVNNIQNYNIFDWPKVTFKKLSVITAEEEMQHETIQSFKCIIKTEMKNRKVMKFLLN